MIAEILEDEAVIIADGSALRAAAAAGLRGTRVIVPDVVLFEARRRGFEDADALVERIGATVFSTEDLDELLQIRKLKPAYRGDGMIISAITAAATSLGDAPTVLLYDPAEIRDSRYYVSGSKSLRVVEI
jgi:hypothetical protein